MIFIYKPNIQDDPVPRRRWCHREEEDEEEEEEEKVRKLVAYTRRAVEAYSAARA